MTLSLITPAASPPVSLATVKAWAGVEDDSFDPVLDAMRLAAIGHVEEVLGRALGVQTWRLTLDAFSDAIELPRGPVLGVAANSFKYIDPAGAPQVVPAETYSLDLVSTPGWIVRNEGASWPEALDRVNAVQVDFEAGWTETLLPPAMRAAVCMLAVNWFENRSAVNVGNITTEMPLGFNALIQPWRDSWVVA